MIKMKHFKLRTEGRNFILLIAVFNFLLLVLFSGVADAAIIYFSPAESAYNAGDTFIQEIRLNTEGEFINAVSIAIEYPEQLIILEDASRGNSILSLWPDDPQIKNNQISFTGGIPAGYQGSDGLLLKLAFRIKSLDNRSATTTKFIISNSSKALLNDGKATLAEVSFKNATLNIAYVSSDETKNEWENEILNDATSPEPFEIFVSKDSLLFGGKYFISFQTMDKQSGIDHYEVLEYYNGGRMSENKNARSPYLLENQELDGIIRVRAVDKRGNEAISEMRPDEVPEKRYEMWNYLITGVIIVITFVIIGSLWLLLKRRKKLSVDEKPHSPTPSTPLI